MSEMTCCVSSVYEVPPSGGAIAIVDQPGGNGNLFEQDDSSIIADTDHDEALNNLNGDGDGDTGEGEDQNRE
jgi:hypothetical protein